MPLSLRSTRILENGVERATVELVISDNAEADKVVESLHIRTLVPLGEDSYLPALQMKAMKRAAQILEEIERMSREKWTSRKP